MLRRLRLLCSKPLAFLIVLLAFQTSPAFAGLNLCIGVGGHLEIESQEAGCCPSQETMGSELSLAQEEGACASCIDVSLGDHAANTLASVSNPTSQVFLPAPLILELLKPLRLSPTAFQGRHVSIEPSLTAIRTVVLRV